MKSWQGVIEPQNKRFLMDDSSPAVVPRRDVSFGSKTIVLIFAKKASTQPLGQSPPTISQSLEKLQSIDKAF